MRIIVIFLFAKVCHRKRRIVIYKCSLCLCYKRCSVRKKKDILNPRCIKKYMAKFDYSSCLTGTCCHDKKCLTSILLIKAVTYSLNRSFLIITSGNLFIDIYMSKGCPHPPEIKHLFKVCLGIYASDFSLRILSVYNSCFETIG